MSDLVERLRRKIVVDGMEMPGNDALHREAADEIERQAKRIEELEEALLVKPAYAQAVADEKEIERLTAHCAGLENADKVRRQHIAELEAVLMTESQKTDLLAKEHYRKRIAELEAELHGTVTTKYHDEIVQGWHELVVKQKATNERLRAALERIASGSEDSDYYRNNPAWWLRGIAGEALAALREDEDE